MIDAYVCDAIRTPIGRFGGGLAQVRADDLAAVPLKALLERNKGIDPTQIDDVIFGCANQAGEDNRNVARMGLLLAGLPVSIPGSTVNRLCGSGLDAVTLAARAIRAGEAELMIAGGVESMTRAPFVMPKASSAFSRNAEIYDTTIGWRFVNPLMKSQYGVDSMPETAENVAADYNVSRADQDAMALRSQKKAAAAQESGRLAMEITPVTVKEGKKTSVVEKDEQPRPDTTLEKLAALPTPFRAGGSVTAGNASGVNDGACALVIASERAAKKYGLTPRARIVGGASAGVAPRVMGIGPVPATQKLLARTNVALSAIDVIELNEAFAAQGLAVLRQLGVADDDPRVNPNGGAIALGHPLGMSGARLVATASYELAQKKTRYALCTMCIGVGQGIALLIERVYGDEDLRTTRDPSGASPRHGGTRRALLDGRRGRVTSPLSAAREIDARAAGFSPARLARITEFLQREYLEPGKIAGCQVLVARRGQLAYRSTLGAMDLERKRPLRDDALFRIYSMTKPITSIALMQLFEQGRFQLHEPIADVIPAFRELKVYVSGHGEQMVTRAPDRPLSFRDILSHQGGISYGGYDGKSDSAHPVDQLYRALRIGSKKDELATFVHKVAQVPLRFSPGERWLYSFSTDVVGHLVEQLSGQRLDRYLEQHILAPLGMRDTSFAVQPDRSDRLCACYGPDENGGLTLLDDPEHSEYAREPTFLAGGHGLLSTLADYHRFCEMLRCRGELDGARILGSRTLALMTKNHLPGGQDLTQLAVGAFSETGNEGIGFGLGFATTLDGPASGTYGAGDFFWGGKASTLFWVDPREQIVAIFMTQLMPSSTYDFRGPLKALVYSSLAD